MSKTALSRTFLYLLVPALLAGGGLAAMAQSPSSNLNSINESLARQAEIRNLQQQQTSDSNLIRMNQQRIQQSAPPATAPIIVAPPR